MKFCEECGAKLEKESKFCEECGTKVEEESNKPASGQPKPTPKLAPKRIERKPLSKGKKVIISSIVAVLLLLFGGYNLGSAVYSEENQKEEILNILIEKDAEALADVIVSSDPNLEITSYTIEPFIDYLDAYPNYLSELVNELNHFGESGPLAIRQNGRQFYLYDSYELMINPVYASVYTNADGAVISMNDEELLTSTSDSFERQVGPFIPGIHHFDVSGEINGNPLTTSHLAEWIDSHHHYQLDLSLIGTTFNVNSDLKEATVYLNGEEVGQLRDGYGEFGPVQWEEGMLIHVSQSFGDDELVSEEVEFTEYNNSFTFTNLNPYRENDVYNVISGMYNRVALLARRYNDSDVEALNAYFDSEGSAYEEQRKDFLTFAEDMSEDEDVTQVRFNVTLNNYEQTGINTFDVEYEVTYTTIYTFRSGKDTATHHFSKEASVIFEETNNPSRDFDSLITEIRNEELLYQD